MVERNAEGNLREIPIHRRKGKRLSFFDLPPEIRQNVYELYFSDYDNFRPYWTVREHYNPQLDLDSDEESPVDSGHVANEPDEDDGEDLYGDNYRITVRNVEDGDHSNDGNVIVINQAGYLHTNIPMLCVCNRALFSETWQFIYDEDAVLVVHVNDLAVTEAFKKTKGILKILHDVCAFTAIEERTYVVMHGAHRSWTRHEGGILEESVASRNLREWLLKYWHGQIPLFDMNLQVMRVKGAFIGGKSSGWAESHAPERCDATMFRKYLGIVKYLRMLQRADAGVWKLWAELLIRNGNLGTKAITKYNQYTMAEDRRKEGQREDHQPSDLTDRMIDAVIRWAHYYSRRGRTVFVEQHLQYFERLRETVRDTVGKSRFEELEQVHLQSSPLE